MENMIRYINFMYIEMSMYSHDMYICKKNGQHELELHIRDKVMEMCERIENLIKFYKLENHFKGFEF